MQIVKIDRKNHQFEVVPHSFDDLWHLERLIEKGDRVSGTSERKIKPKEEGDKPYKEKIYVELEVEKVIFHESTNQLRIQGTVVAAKPEELVPLKSHHTIEAEVGKSINVTKKSLKNFHVERLQRAKNASGHEKVLLVIMDDEQADLVFLKDTGIDTKARIIAQKEGKMFKTGEKGKTKPYFEELLKKILDLGSSKIVVAGPGFERQNFEKFLKEKSPKLQVIFESTNSIGLTGINELVKGGKIDKVIEGFHSTEEAKAVERVLASISQEMCAIGQKEVLESVQAGACQEIVILESKMHQKNQNIEKILDSAEQFGAKIFFVADKSEPGKQLDGMGAIAAVLRYRKKW